MTNENDTKAAGTVVHQFVEVAADLLAKPSALCDLVESQAGKAVLVFCNNPSDTDFVEVILKKRGISAVKLIGFVAPEKLEKTQEKVKAGEISAVVITDVAARGIDFSLFSSVVNYSLPSDLDVYNTRAAVGAAGDRTAVSIVGPLDFAIFHQLKTTTNFEFTKREPPSKEDLAKAKLNKVKSSATAKSSSLDPSLNELAKQICKDSDSNLIVAYLLQNLFDVVPQLQSQVDRLTWEKENREHDDDQMGQDSSEQSFRGGRDSRGNRGQRGRDRGYDRDDQGDRRDGGRRRRQDRQHDQQDAQDHGQDQQPDRDDNYNEERGSRNRRDDRRSPPPQKIRDDRLYIGSGEKDGMSEAAFSSLLKDHCGLEKEQLKRFFLRKNYAFADLPEGLAENVIQKLDGLEGKKGPLYVARATQVVTVIENEAQNQESEGQEEQTFEGDEQASA